MKIIFYLILYYTAISCGSSRKNTTQKYFKGNISVPHDFTYFNCKDSFNVTITRFYKNDAYCFTEGIPYALIIGKVDGRKQFYDTISVLAKCDNRSYQVWEKIRVVPIENPELGEKMHKIAFVTDTSINGVIYRWVVGSEYPAIWGRVISKSK